MLIRVTCECGAEFRIAVDVVGADAKCPDCGRPVLVPRAPSVEAENVVGKPNTDAAGMCDDVFSQMETDGFLDEIASETEIRNSSDWESSGPIVPRDMAKEALKEGCSLLEQGDFESAITAFTEVLLVHPESAEAYHNRGIAHANTCQFDKAVRDLTETVRINPQIEEAHVSRSAIYFDRGEFDATITDCTNALQINPYFVEAYNLRGNAHLAKGENDEAIVDYTKLLELQQDSLVYFRRGLAYKRSGKIFQARQDFARAKKLGYEATPYDWGARKDLLFSDLSLEEVVRMPSCPDDSEFVRALTSVNNGDYQEAKDCLRRVLADCEREVSQHLMAWKNLRKLGEWPPTRDSDEIRGVVLEYPMENWGDSLVAYSDGQVVYSHGLGESASFVWNCKKHERISSLVAALLAAAKPVVDRTEPQDTHHPTKPEVIRVSVLTYAGIHVAEVEPAKLQDEDSPVPAAVYAAGRELLMTISMVSKTMNKE